jgi:hypothetical protein
MHMPARTMPGTVPFRLQLSAHGRQLEGNSRSTALWYATRYTWDLRFLLK